MKDQDLSTLIAVRDHIERHHKLGTHAHQATEDWRLAGYPPVPFPVEIWGPELVSNGDGRCPVDGDEVVSRLVLHESDRRNDAWIGSSVSEVHWDCMQTYRRKLADHPGDLYTLGAVETVPEGGKVDLKVWELVVLDGHSTPRRAGGYIWLARGGEAFRRVLTLATP